MLFLSVPLSAALVSCPIPLSADRPPSFSAPSSFPVPSLPSFLSSPLSCFFSLLSYAPFCISPCLLSPCPPPLRVTPLRTSPYPAASPQLSMPHLSAPSRSVPRPLFPVRALPAVLPFRAPCQIPSFGCFRRTNAGKGEFRAKKGPKSFFGKNAMKNCNFRARVL